MIPIAAYFPPVLFLLLALLILIIMVTKAPSSFWQNFGLNLKTFYLYVALFVGLITVLINGVTLTKTFLEETVFPVEYNYVDYYSCNVNNYDQGIKSPVSAGETTTVMTDDERTKCEERALERGRDDRKNEVNRQYSSGAAGLLFGLLIWITHFAWIRRNK